MSDEVFTSRDLTVTRFIGPETLGPDRQLWQFYTQPEGTSALNRAELMALVVAIMQDLAGDTLWCRAQAYGR